MTFEPSATPEQISARQQAFDNQPDPAMLVSREEIRAALLDRHTAATQDKLDSAHVAICGCGGLGSTIAVALTRIGVGHLHLIDFDRVDMTNLNRQQYFLKDLGQYKTEALRSNLRQINPFIDITIDTDFAHSVRYLTASNGSRVARWCWPVFAQLADIADYRPSRCTLPEGLQRFPTGFDIMDDLKEIKRVS